MKKLNFWLSVFALLVAAASCAITAINGQRLAQIERAVQQMEELRHKK